MHWFLCAYTYASDGWFLTDIVDNGSRKRTLYIMKTDTTPGSKEFPKEAMCLLETC